jgi:hypothetical protein
VTDLNFAVDEPWEFVEDRGQGVSLHVEEKCSDSLWIVRVCSGWERGEASETAQLRPRHAGQCLRRVCTGEEVIANLVAIQSALEGKNAMLVGRVRLAR